MHIRLLCAALLLGGCTQPQSTQSTATPVKVEQRAQNFVEAGEIRKLLDQVEAQAGKPLRFLEIRVSQSYFEIQVQDPKNPENADSYQCRGSEPLRKVPVRTNGATAKVLKQSSAPLADLKVEALPSLLAAADAKAKNLEGREEPSLHIACGTTGKFEWNLYLRGSRKSVHVTATLAGVVQSVDLR